MKTDKKSYCKMAPDIEFPGFSFPNHIYVKCPNKISVLDSITGFNMFGVKHNSNDTFLLG